MPSERLESKRVALVIGNSAYSREALLTNPKNDAADIASELTRLHFDVTLAVDLDRASIRETIAGFVRNIKETDAAVFYYAGHGLQLDGENYLIPIDADIETERDVPFNAQKLDDILRAMTEASKASLIILDACRNNPFTRSIKRSIGTGRAVAVGDGLAEVRAGGDVLIAYATQPNNTAEDGVGSRNSPYTTALLRHIAKPGVQVEQLLKKVGGDVRARTNGKQVPWYHSALTTDFEFNPIVRNIESASEDHPWLTLEKHGGVSAIRGFINNFPNDRYVIDAQKRLGELEAEAWEKVRGKAHLETLTRFQTEFPTSRYDAIVSQRIWKLELFAILSLCLIGLLTGCLSGVSAHFTKNQNILSAIYLMGSTPYGLWWNLGVFAFACTIPLGLSVWWPQNRSSIVYFIVATLLAWMVAHLFYQLLGNSLGITTRTKEEIENVEDELTRVRTRYEFLAQLFTTGAASCVGAALTMAAASRIWERVRKGHMTVITTVGASAAAIPEFLFWSKYHATVLFVLLFVTWQVWVAGCICYAYIKGRPAA